MLPVHDGHDWMYVLDGRLRLVLGEDDLRIEPGEAVEFATSTPHWFGAVDGPVVVVGIFGAHGERAHLERLSEVTPGWRHDERSPAACCHGARTGYVRTP